jgi:hypothetical protein
MQTKEIQTEFDATFTELLNLLSSFDQEQFNTKPAIEKWSAGQVAGHLIKATSGFAQLLNSVRAETERRPDEMVEKIRVDFSNFERKMTAPDFIMPEDKIYEREDLLKSFNKIKSEINEAVQTADLTKNCLAFKLPVYGFLTGLELLSFVTAHIQRHNFQLKRIHEKF